MKWMLVIPATVLVAGCQTVGPTWSELSGARYHMAIVDRQAVVVAKVDGASTPLHGKVQIPPGRHEIVVESLPHGAFRAGYQQTLVLDVAPCRRYYINGQYRNRVDPDYEPVVDEIEPISGCRPGLG